MNTNLVHNVINVSIALISGLEVIDWTPFPNAAMIVAGLAITKLLINVFRDGIFGLTKTQPPVK